MIFLWSEVVHTSVQVTQFASWWHTVIICGQLSAYSYLPVVCLLNEVITFPAFSTAHKMDDYCSRN
jgi:hypothetical protein